MCVVSMVYDHFYPLFPDPLTIPSTFPSLEPLTPDQLSKWFDPQAELRKLIKEFQDAVEAAKKVDILTKQPDCADPEKKKLEERVAALELKLDALEKMHDNPKKAKKTKPRKKAKRGNNAVK